MPAPLITIAEARQRVLSAAAPLGTEQVAIDDARDRVLAADLTAAGDVPPFPCSAMDGYAVLDGDAGRTLIVVGESRAGAPTATALDDGSAIRFSTGGAIPAGATAVIPQENV
ncbi:MAG: molybdopterin molybdenumtransferase MoeA, partial [Solirubrobacteraceae bacterium]